MPKTVEGQQSCGKCTDCGGNEYFCYGCETVFCAITPKACSCEGEKKPHVCPGCNGDAWYQDIYDIQPCGICVGAGKVTEARFAEVSDLLK